MGILGEELSREYLKVGSLQAMWRKLQHLFLDMTTCADLGPDLHARRQVNRVLKQRPALALNQAYEYFWQSRGIPYEIISFIYDRLETYSGLSFARVLPGDRLEEDLKLTLVSCFDWHLTFCEEFYDRYGVDLSESLDLVTLRTVEDFVVFLNCQLQPVSS